MFKLVGAAKRYDGATALEPADFEFKPGRTTVLAGPSGCGKSTILRLLAGLIEPDAGQVLFLGTPLTKSSIREVRRCLGYVIQEGGLFPHLTARRNATLVAEYQRRDQAAIAERLQSLTTLVQLPPDLLERYPAELSGGQRQRVSLLRAMFLDPDVLLLDEPLGALDPLVRFDLQNDLKRIFASLSKTVIMVTHDMAEAAVLADELVLLRSGRIVQRGTVKELLANPADAWVERFFRAQRVRIDTVEEQS